MDFEIQRKLAVTIARKASELEDRSAHTQSMLASGRVHSDYSVQDWQTAVNTYGFYREVLGLMENYSELFPEDEANQIFNRLAPILREKTTNLENLMSQMLCLTQETKE